MAYPAGTAISVESTSVMIATTTLLRMACRMPCVFRKNDIVSVEIGAGKNCFGKARTFSGALRAIVAISHIGTRIHAASAIATAYIPARRIVYAVLARR